MTSLISRAWGWMKCYILDAHDWDSRVERLSHTEIEGSIYCSRCSHEELYLWIKNTPEDPSESNEGKRNGSL